METNILNVGCGADTYGTHFVDLYPNRPEVRKCKIDQEKLPFPDQYFDEVYSRNLFEHLTNPGFVVKEMTRVLKKDGKLVIITDNASYIGFHLSMFGSNMHSGGYRGMGNKDRHYALYTLEHLKNFLENVNMKKIDCKYSDGYSQWYAKLLKYLIRILAPKMSYPHIKATGIK